MTGPEVAMLSIYQKFVAVGLQISKTNLISMTFLWPDAIDKYWAGKNPNSVTTSDDWSIGGINQAFQDLVTMGKIPNLS